MSDEIPRQIQDVLIQHVGRSETGIAVIDSDDRFQYCNQAFIKMFGLQDFSPIGRTHDEFLMWMYTHRMGRSVADMTLEAWLDQVHATYRSQEFDSFEAGMSNGKWVLVTEQVYDDGNLVAVCTDVTTSKEAELALHVAYAELERLAMTDELTDVANRRAFLAQLETERQRALRYERPASLVMLDLDHFKQVNDRHGHPAGDQVLKHFGGLLRNHLRSEDLAGRLGGEEFGLLLPETEAPGALSVVERIREVLSQVRLDSIAPGFDYTFSAGIAGFPVADPVTCNRWMRNADKALYQAKAEGRNRTVLFDA